MWIPKSHNFTQLENWGDGGGLNGHNNCFEGALARALAEMGYPFTGSDHDFIAQIRLRATGLAETSNEGYTSYAQAEAYLRTLNILTGVYYGSPSMAARPWTISCIRGQELLPAQYPPTWFPGDAPDHFILQMPDGWINDPLAYYNGTLGADGVFHGKDCKYTDLSRAITDGNSYTLRDPGTFTWTEGEPGRYVAVPNPVAPVAPVAPPKLVFLQVSVGKGRMVYGAPDSTGKELGLTTGQPMRLVVQGDPYPWWRVELPNGQPGFVRQETHDLITKS